jgi:hypothetical protein
MSVDLKEILTWPKALKSITHEIETEESSGGLDRQNTSPEVFINGVYSQRDSLEEISYNNGPKNEDANAEPAPTTFGSTLREFPSLKRLCVPRACLVMTEDEGRDFHGHTLSLYEVLPPNLEDLIIELESNFKWECWKDMDDGSWGEEYEPELKEWLLGVAVHKMERFTSLKRVVLWVSPIRFRQSGDHEMDEVLMSLYVFTRTQTFASRG